MIKILIPLFLLKFSLTLYECTNNKDPSSLTNKQYLKAFSKGPCSPFLIIPCLSGSKLVLKIDCKVLKKENPKIFETCRWTNCEKKPYEFWKSVPEKEYNLWYPSPTSPLSIFSPLNAQGKCFASFMKLEIDFKKKIENSLKKTKGFQIRVFGNTKETEKKSGCGDNVITDMLPSPIQLDVTKMWEKFLLKAKLMGYRRGISYQALPYDWRLSFKNNKLGDIFFPNVKRIFGITGKKVVLVGHSFGVRNIYYQLLKIPQVLKDKMVRVWAGVGGNFLGSWYSDIDLVAGTNIFQFLFIFGLGIPSIVETINNSLSVYEARSRDHFKLFEGEEFFERIKARMDYERDYFDDFEKSGFDFLPKKTDICSSKNSNFDQACIMGFFNSKEYNIMSINKKKYYMKDLDKLISDYQLVKDSKNFIQHTKQEDFLKLENPGVSYISFSLRTMPTTSTQIWNSTLKDKIKNGKYYKPDKIIYSYGDETIPTISLLLAPLKWAHEFEKKKKNSKPIKIIDVCSIYNQRNSIYDKTDENSEFEINKNEFIGMNCEDFDKKIPDSACHSKMISDKYFIEFFGNILLSNEKSFSEEYEKFVDEMDSEFLDGMTRDDCPQIKYVY